ncbi:MAG: hypothetical protein LAT82_00305 [Nanoarchaeota archaeon]|nr:hypothetical protein [Nanoarchaeota archaeon]
MSLLTSILLKDVFQLLIVIIAILVIIAIPMNYYNDEYYMRMSLAELERTIILFGEHSKIEIRVLEFENLQDIRFDRFEIIAQLENGKVVTHETLRELPIKNTFFDEDSQNIVIIT